MNDSTRHILRWCPGDNRGMRSNPVRLQSRRLAGMILPIDQGLERGPGQLM
jgi:hypothetical protein